jgi:hypothetical protein
MTQGKDPSSILRTGFGFWESKVLLTAVEFELFTVLGDKAMTGGRSERSFHCTRGAIGTSSTR